MNERLSRLTHLKSPYLLEFDLAALLLTPVLAIRIRLEDLGAIERMIIPRLVY